MKKPLKKISTQRILTLCYFVLVFLVLLLVIRPELLYQRQQPVFFFGADFFTQQLDRPGGMLAWLSAFFSQFYYVPAAGALVMTLILALISTLFRALLKKPLQLFPIVPLLVLHGVYDHELAVDLGIAIALLFTAVYSRLPLRIRPWLLPVLLVLLHSAIGGAALLFVLLCAVIEVIETRRVVVAAAAVLLAAVWPYISARVLYLITLKDAYLGGTALITACRPAWIAGLSYAVYPLLLVLDRLLRPAQRRVWIWLRTATLFGLSALALFMGWDRITRTLMQIDYHGHRGQWEKVIEIARTRGSAYGLVTYQLNRALYHSGRMAEELFAAPQRLGVDGLFIPPRFQHLVPLQHSDLFFDLGLVNEAQRWAHEALSVTGDTPYNLQRLAEIYLIKGERSAAGKCLRMLRRTLWFRSWAEKYLTAQDPLADDARLRAARSRMPEQDFVIAPEHPQHFLRQLLNHRSGNRMAFEYLMAYDLLSGDLNHFMENIPLIRNFDINSLPESYQEAVVLVMSQTAASDFDLGGLNVNYRTVERYRRFTRILKEHGNDRDAARAALRQEHAGTYWYYLIYIKPADGR